MKPSTLRKSGPAFESTTRGAALVAIAVALLFGPTVALADWPTAEDRPSRAEAPLPKSFGFESTKDSTTDPTGDTFGTGSPQLDITAFAANGANGNYVFNVTFSGAISAPDSGEANAVGGFIDIDADQDGNTGDVPWVDFLTGSTNSGLGNEFYVDLFSYSSIDGAVDVVDDVNETVVGRAPASFSASSFNVQVPAALLGDPSDAIDTAVVAGTFAEPTDIAPNTGSIMAQAPGAPPCPGAATSTSLQGGRFMVDVSWSAQPDYPNPRPACVSNLRTEDSGIFYFLDPNNLEFLIKVVDACDFNDHYWVYLAGTTDVDFTVTVTDTATDETRQYFNTQGHPADAITDSSAFATCP